MIKLPKNIKYIIIGLAIGIIIFVGYYFFDHRNNLEIEVTGISKDKVLLADEKEYNLDVILNSILNNQFVLQESVNLLEGRISSLEDKIKLMEEQEDDNN